MKPKIAVFAFFICCLLLGGGFHSTGECAPNGGYHRIVILSDPHYPSKTPPDAMDNLRQKKINAKEEVIKQVNTWDDVELVVVLGDIVEKTGSIFEYEQAKEFISGIHKPVAVIAGNHEFMYEDQLSNGKLQRADPELRQEKLQRFATTFNLPELYYSKQVGQYLLIFLSPDKADSKYLTEISDKQLQWLKETLDQHKTMPTLIFFHAPLAGTLENYSRHVNSPQFIAQPVASIQQILESNPQVVIWASGHTHTPATNPSFNADINLYQNRVLNVHNSDMDRLNIWTNSLYLFPHEIKIKTYDHKKGEFMSEMDRTISLPGELANTAASNQ